MSLAPGSRLGSFEILAPLGAGAMGEVCRARDSRLGRDVALKVLPASLARDADRLARFDREAKLLASLNHPNIAAIYGLEDAGGTPALVLELVEGPTLADRIAEGPLPPREAADIARQIAEALEYAHDRGVVHRDLKPANVKIDGEGRVKVLDFGLAKAIASDASPSASSAVSPTITSLGTVAGVILGTAAYMSPEQARGANVDRRADIWAFGAVVWEMLTGKRLFEDETVSDTLASVLRAPLLWDDLPASVPPGLRHLLERCLERDPRKRLRDIGEARIALETLDWTAPKAAAAAAAPRRPATLPWVLLAVVVVAGIVAIALLAGRKPHPPPVTRFHVALDPQLASMTWPRISPDGTKIAFLGRDTAGKSSVWIRPLDSFAAYPLQGTEGSARMWWAPDGKFVAFFVGTQLKKAPVAGGPVQLIAEVEGGADGTWGSTGTILFDGRAIDPIRGVSASGGVASQQTSPDEAKGEAGHAWPFFLPDGKHYLFLVMPKGANEKAKIAVGEVGRPGHTELGPTDSRVEYGNGYVVYVLAGTLVARRFDPKTLKASGEPIPLADRVGTDVNDAAPFSVSSNGVLIYLQGGSGTTSSLVWVDRHGQEIGKIGDAAAYRDLALSPDETRLAYGMADLRTGAEDIWVRDLKRDVASRLTFDPKNEIWPVWSPDGRRIAFASDRNGHFELMVKDAAGTGEDTSLLAEPDRELGPSDWSRDGRWLSYSELPASRRWNIAMLPMQGPKGAKPVPYLSTGASERSGMFSPDGRYVAYASRESGRYEVYVQPYPATGGKWQISNAGGVEPQWRADGKEIFYRGLADEFDAVPISEGPPFEPGVPKLLFKRTLEESSIERNRWTVSRDGQRFLLNATLEAAGSPPFSVVLNWPQSLGGK